MDRPIIEQAMEVLRSRGEPVSVRHVEFDLRTPVALTSEDTISS
jgi:hypothetical protein